MDDDRATREMVEEMLGEAGLDVFTATSAAEAVAMSQDREFGVTLTDLQMPEMDGLQLLASLRELRPKTPVILMTAFGSIATAVEAIRGGATDYVTKPFSSDAVLVALERAFERRELEEENRRLRLAVDRTASFGDLVGKSAAMNEIYALIRKISGNRSNVLITGESGTGKEVVARAIHFSGPRASRALVPINCSAMPEGVLESELFGHAKGAFTGAHTDKKGLFEEANGGSIFLDEIGDMPLSLQSKLLRVLQEREVRPVGANRAVKISARVIAASNRDLKHEVEEGAFREDLYYRLNVIPVHIPPLRERPDDIRPLAESFVRKHAEGPPPALSESALRRLQGAPWKGNARELENSIERALALAEGEVLHASDILIADDPIRADGSLEETVLRLALDRRISVHDLTELYINSVLEATGGRKSEAAELLGMNRRTLYRRDERIADGRDTPD
ncbi:sigma-54 dependent transcriptional regulator [Planctomycetota bacterium]|nr:sigma-54 dependent transcriptional regulator [Planctomycetota bacterium]